ncbi:M6 metalloprotease [Apiospora kogelbergensis]|uniref:M6 metalloprotease n=1 Tax=Apiospora kogelbergensis TaxID=1337665 RepID=A0AAW0R4W9_9PEZI
MIHYCSIEPEYKQHCRRSNRECNFSQQHLTHQLITLLSVFCDYGLPTHLRRCGDEPLVWRARYAVGRHHPPLALAAADTNVAACKLDAGSGANSIRGFDLKGAVPAASGEVRGWMMFVDFPDAQAADAGYSAKGVYDSVVPPADPWFRTASNGRMSLNVSADVDRIYRMPKNSTAYHWDNMAATYGQMVFLEDALEAYMDANGIAAEDIKSKLPDLDVLYVVPSPNAPNFRISYAPQWPPQTRSRNGTDGNIVEGETVARRAVTFGTNVYRDQGLSDGGGLKGWKMLVHETSHTLGLPDYYPLELTRLEGEFVGGFSIMGAIGEVAPDMFAFDKWRLGWMDDSAMQCITEKGSSTHVLQPLAADSGVRAVMIPTSRTTALVAEARTPGASTPSPAPRACFFYTIDTEVVSGSGPVRVVDTLEQELHWCGGYSLNMAPLSFVELRSSSKTIKELGITVTLLEHDESADTWKIKVDYN